MDTLSFLVEETSLGVPDHAASATGHVQDIHHLYRRISKAVERSSDFMGPPLAERIAA